MNPEALELSRRRLAALDHVKAVLVKAGFTRKRIPERQSVLLKRYCELYGIQIPQGKQQRRQFLRDLWDAGMSMEAIRTSWNNKEAIRQSAREDRVRKREEKRRLKTIKRDAAYQKYVDYISKDPRWRTIRCEVLAERGLLCQKCLRPFPRHLLHVHHMTYRNLYQEIKSDLLVLCKRCHKEVHAMPRKDNPYFI